MLQASCITLPILICWERAKARGVGVGGGGGYIEK